MNDDNSSNNSFPKIHTIKRLSDDNNIQLNKTKRMNRENIIVGNKDGGIQAHKKKKKVLELNDNEDSISIPQKCHVPSKKSTKSKQSKSNQTRISKSLRNLRGFEREIRNFVLRIKEVGNVYYILLDIKNRNYAAPKWEYKCNFDLNIIRYDGSKVMPTVTISSISTQGIFQCIIKKKILKSDRVIGTMRKSSSYNSQNTNEEELLTSFKIPIEGGYEDVSYVLKEFEPIGTELLPTTSFKNKKYGKYKFLIKSNIAIKGTLMIDDSKILSQKIEVDFEPNKEYNVSIICFIQDVVEDKDLRLRIFIRTHNIPKYTDIMPFIIPNFNNNNTHTMLIPTTSLSTLPNIKNDAFTKQNIQSNTLLNNLYYDEKVFSLSEV